MKTSLILPVVSVIGFLFAASGASAALVLNGYTTGNFEGSSTGNITITNSSDGRTDSFVTGIPVGGSFQSGIYFTGADFANISNGDVFSMGAFKFVNGITALGTSSGNVAFDFKIHLSDPVTDTLKLTTFDFGIHATPNAGGLVPDQFTTTFSQPAPVLIDDTWVTFTINHLPVSFSLAEEAMVKLADVTVNFRDMDPAPEPASLGLIATLGLVALATYKRVRNRFDAVR